METNLPTVVSDILRVVGKEWRGAVVYDRTTEAADHGRQEVRQQVTEAEDESDER